MIIGLKGAIAQLGERFAGSEEVVGSIPSSSTKNHKVFNDPSCCLFFEYITQSPQFSVTNCDTVVARYINIFFTGRLGPPGG